MTKGEQARLMAWRLRVLPEAAAGQNVARVCRRFGISRKSFYKWKGRQAEFGDAGLCDRPRTPQRFPRATSTEIVSKILYLRQHTHRLRFIHAMVLTDIQLRTTSTNRSGSSKET